MGAAKPLKLDPGLCAQMYFLYVCLLLGALNRLPIKLPRRGAGRRHSTAAAAAAAITFDDVAGVDEAKEELSEIVVRFPLLCELGLCSQPPPTRVNSAWDILQCAAGAGRTLFMRCKLARRSCCGRRSASPN